MLYICEKQSKWTVTDTCPGDFHMNGRMVRGFIIEYCLEHDTAFTGSPSSHSASGCHLFPRQVTHTWSPTWCTRECDWASFLVQFWCTWLWTRIITLTGLQLHSWSVCHAIDFLTTDAGSWTSANTDIFYYGVAVSQTEIRPTQHSEGSFST